MAVSTDPRKTGISAAATLLTASAVAIPHTGTTDETALATVTIPAGAMGLNGGLLVYSTWSCTNSANDKIPRTRFGGIAGTAFGITTLTTSASFGDLRRIRNRNSASSQVGHCGATAGSVFGTSSSTVVTSAINTAAAADLVLSGQLESGSETLTLESYEVWLLP